MIPDAPITVLLVVKEKADMYSSDGWLRTRYNMCQTWQSEHTSIILFDRPASNTSFYNWLEAVRVQRLTFGAAAAWWYRRCYGDESNYPKTERGMNKKKRSGMGYNSSLRRGVRNDFRRTRPEIVLDL